jgi:hypothetical protein
MFLSPALLSIAQEPAPATPGVRITFVPPPMEGTWSLGIYDAAGKLVRVLARDATEKDFTVGLNGLMITWDGRDDAGRPLPKGSYSARGFSVGALEVEGVAMHGNDWVNDAEALRIRRVRSGTLEAGGSSKTAAERRMSFLAETAEGKLHQLTYNSAGKLLAHLPAEKETAVASAFSGVTLRENKVYLAGSAQPLPLEGVGETIAAAVDGKSVWVIDRAPTGKTQVKQYSTAGEFRRELKIGPEDPQPVRVSASPVAEEIMLIEENAATQRVRVLALEKPAEDSSAAGGPAISTWKTVFTRSVIASDEFALVADQVGRLVPFIPRAKFTAKLVPNSLLKDALTTADVTIGFDTKGSFIKTMDGLPLRRITEAAGLRWAVIGEEGSGRQLTIFQGDGAVIEEFKARKLANMMAFDAGEYDWDPAGKK